MRTIFIIETIAPVSKSNGAFSNKSIAFDVIHSLVGNNLSVVDEESDQYLKFHNKLINYINFTKYFKNADNCSKLVLKIVNPDSKTNAVLTKTIKCTMYVVNQKI